ncbi:MAG: hypothetical protein LUB63_05625 [Oscillospiraceae bacterium]|nr:hypothetical protein [Oscillospiraceae bacterium]
MGKRVGKVLDLPSSGAFAALLILSISFFLGGMAGCLLAGQAEEGTLSQYLAGYLSDIQNQGAYRPQVLALLWELVRWPLLVFALSFTPFRLPAIPVAMLFHGFLLSFAISSFFCVYRLSGLALAFLLFGISGMIGVTVLFLLGVQGVLRSAALLGRLMGERGARPLFSREDLPRCGICALGLLLCGILEYFAVPELVEALAGVLSF